MTDNCENTNNVFGCHNIINEELTVASLAEGFENQINSGGSNHVEGFQNIIMGGTGNHAEGQQNIINGGIANHIEGEQNIINPLEAGFIRTAENCHVEGIGNKVAGEQNHVEGCNHSVYGGFQAHVVGCSHQVADGRAGQNISGYGGYFLYDRATNFGGDKYNYSNQLGGGNSTSEYPGEGISVIDKTLLSGVYPIGQHQAYRNTSDGLSYSIMLKGVPGLKQGTFVTYEPNMRRERLIMRANSCDDIIGVISKSAGFIANAGQFPASTRIRYDEFHVPMEFENRSTTPPYEFLFPGHQVVLKDNVDREIPFIPFNERLEYYEVTLLGLVVVKTYKASRLGTKCSVEDGKAVKGDKFWVVKIIDDTHVMILLK
ncbi:Hypothetical protein HVR_LOCUS1192 [uncultured virus]|nr:Hypothetical protein HVR_LOCUS1192 [uncultured virus]